MCFQLRKGLLFFVFLFLFFFLIIVVRCELNASHSPLSDAFLA